MSNNDGIRDISPFYGGLVQEWQIELIIEDLRVLDKRSLIKVCKLSVNSIREEVLFQVVPVGV